MWGGSYTGEVELWSVLVDDGRAGLSQKDMEPYFIIITNVATLLSVYDGKNSTQKN